MKQKGKISISAKEFDKLFDGGKENIMPYLEMDSVHHPDWEAKRVNVDFPKWMLSRLDSASSRIGITRQALIKILLAEKLDGMTHQ